MLASQLKKRGGADFPIYRIDFEFEDIGEILSRNWFHKGVATIPYPTSNLDQRARVQMNRNISA